MRFHYILASIAIALLAACGGDSNEARTPATQANGKAYLDAPLVGATVRVHDATGAPVETTGPTTTSSYGTFSFQIANRKTERIRVSVSGGTYAGKPFHGTLMLDVDRYDASRDLLYVNAPTTMVSEYLVRNPGITVEQANAKVYGFLGVPEPSRSGFALDNPHQHHFRHELMLAEVQANGSASLNHYLGTLLDQMQAGTAERRFSRQMVGSVADTIKEIATSLAEHLGDELFSWGFESVLSALGLGANAEILKQLEEINAKLDELKNMVAGLERDVAEAKVEIVNTPLVSAMSGIAEQYSYLTWAAQHIACANSDAPADAACKGTSDGIKATVRQRIGNILDANTGVVAQFALLKTSLAGLPSEPGVLRRWHDYLKTTKQFYSPVVDPRLIRLNEYYQTYQLMAAHLIVEAYVARESADGKPNPDKASGSRTLQQFDAAATDQDNLVATLRLENEDIVQDLRNKLTWLRRPVSNFVAPHWVHVSGGSGYFVNAWDEQAASTCRSFADTRYAGLEGWRMPTEDELHAFSKDSPGTGSAQRNDGVFDWLAQQGFLWAPGDGTLNQRGMLRQTAYFSGTWSGEYSHEALWDGGVDNACNTPGGCFGNSPPIAGAWCVTPSGIE